MRFIDTIHSFLHRAKLKETKDEFPQPAIFMYTINRQSFAHILAAFTTSITLSIITDNNLRYFYFLSDKLIGFTYLNHLHVSIYFCKNSYTLDAIVIPCSRFLASCSCSISPGTYTRSTPGAGGTC